MSEPRKIDGFGTRDDGTGTGNSIANLNDVKKIINVYAYCDDGNTAYTIAAGQLLVMEYQSGAGFQVDTSGSPEDVLTKFGFGNVSRLSDAGAQNASTPAGALGTASDRQWAYGVALDTTAIAVGKYQFIRVQVYGKFVGAYVAQSTAKDIRLIADVTAAATSVGVLAGVDAQIDLIPGNTEANIQDMVTNLANSTAVAISLSASAQVGATAVYTADIFLLDPLNLAD